MADDREPCGRKTPIRPARSCGRRHAQRCELARARPCARRHCARVASHGARSAGRSAFRCTPGVRRFAVRGESPAPSQPGRARRFTDGVVRRDRRRAAPRERAESSARVAAVASTAMSGLTADDVRNVSFSKPPLGKRVTTKSRSTTSCSSRCDGWKAGASCPPTTFAACGFERRRSFSGATTRTRSTHFLTTLLRPSPPSTAADKRTLGTVPPWRLSASGRSKRRF